MNLHEYQAKHLLVKYGLSVPQNVLVRSVEESLSAVDVLKPSRWVVKAQIHAGGRAKAGGVKIVSTKEELRSLAERLLNTRLVTPQTHKQGQPVNALLIEEAVDIERELYLSVFLDRTTQKVTFIASAEGGVEIEKTGQERPHKILKSAVDPFLGVMSYQCRALADRLQLKEKAGREFTNLLTQLYKLFRENDLTLIEINPLGVTRQGSLICLDAKLNVDENALYRQPLLCGMHDDSQEEPKELLAKEWSLNYIPLEGNIGCMVNGAGLAMATLDLIKSAGGEPANFLDVGGTATEDRVKEAFKIILSDKKVKAILVNIFGGIVRCDLIAQGIKNAVSEVSVIVPVVVRLEGNRALEAAQILEKSGSNIIAINSFAEAVEQVVQCAGDNP